VVFILAGGVALSTLSIGTLVALPQLGLSGDESRTVGFLLLIFGHVLYPLAARRVSGRSPANLYLFAAIAGAIALQVLAVSVPGLRALLELSPVPVWGVAWAGVGALVAWGVTEGVASVLRKSAS
jgi:hypothetical protein